MRSKVNLVIILIVMTAILIKSTNQLRKIYVRKRIISQQLSYQESKTTKKFPSQRICTQLGIASWYDRDAQNKKTASGERYNPNYLTADSREFPFGTELMVTNLANERNVTVTVNDRGPYKGKRVIDLSAEAARELGMKKAGLAPVCVLEIKKASDKE